MEVMAPRLGRSRAYLRDSVRWFFPSLGYLAVSGVIGLAVLFATPFVGFIAVFTAITFLAPWVVQAFSLIFRATAEFERWRNTWLGRPRIEALYPDPPEGVRGRTKFLLSSKRMWADAAHLLINVVLGFGGALATFCLLMWNAAMLCAPFTSYVAVFDQSDGSRPLGISSDGRDWVFFAIGIIAVPFVICAVHGLAELQSTVAGKVLGPLESDRLTLRNREVVETRARAIDAQAAELRRIERDLHDGTQARLIAIGVNLALADRKLRPLGPEASEAREELASARAGLDAAVADLRHTVRGIYPPILADRGLDGAISALAGDAATPVTVVYNVTGELTPAVEAAAYFVVSEALTNIAKHAQATACMIDVETGRDGALMVLVTDNGQGGADPAGAGLDGLRRRVEALDGTFAVLSPAGGPTTVKAVFGCAS